MRAAVEVRTMVFCAIIWILCDILLRPFLVRAGLLEAYTFKELFHGDWDICWFILTVWMIGGRQISAKQA
jgi:hypothetical protein